MKYRTYLLLCELYADGGTNPDRGGDSSGYERTLSSAEIGEAEHTEEGVGKSFSGTDSSLSEVSHDHSQVDVCKACRFQHIKFTEHLQCTWPFLLGICRRIGIVVDAILQNVRYPDRYLRRFRRTSFACRRLGRILGTNDELVAPI